MGFYARPSHAARTAGSNSSRKGYGKVLDPQELPILRLKPSAKRLRLYLPFQQRFALGKEDVVLGINQGQLSCF